jgi:hypothetical protein
MRGDFRTTGYWPGPYDGRTRAREDVLAAAQAEWIEMWRREHPRWHPSTTMSANPRVHITETSSLHRHAA